MNNFIPPSRGSGIAPVIAVFAITMMAQCFLGAEPPHIQDPGGRTVDNLLAAIPPTDSDSASDTAAGEAKEKVRRHPERAMTWSLLGDALAQKQRDTNDPAWYAPAHMAYQKAWQIEPGHLPALTGLAWTFGGRHEFTESVRWAKLALAADPQNPVAHGIISDAALELGDVDRAYESCQSMMDARPDLSSYSRGAYLIWLTGDTRKARWLMQKAINAGAPVAENTAWCRSRLAMMLFHEGALLSAVQVAEQGLRYAPNHGPLLLALGKIMVALNQHDKAMQAFEMAMGRGFYHEALVALGDLHGARGDVQLAETYYQKVEALHADNAEKGIHDHTQMARFFADHDRRLDRALVLAGEHGESRNIFDADALAWACYKNGDFPRARRVIQTALRLGTQDPEIIYHAGLIAAATGDRPGAQKLLSRALSLNPSFHPLHAPLAAKKLDELATAVAAE